MPFYIALSDVRGWIISVNGAGYSTGRIKEFSMKLLQIMINLTLAAGLMASVAHAQASIDSDVVVATVNGEEIKILNSTPAYKVSE